MQREEIKWNYVKHSIKTKKGIKRKGMRDKKFNETEATTNMVGISQIITINTLNVNESIIPI
jgi:hypothetical protein